MKTAIIASLIASAAAFAPAQQGSRAATTLNAEMSKSLPFMKRPELVSGPFYEVVHRSWHFHRVSL